jgi:hypothetical protein|tara:strand:- start:196 stop:402 length:207 start_codon:yes stop_codon:yes gene_type:complete
MIKLKDLIELLEKELEEKYNFKKQSCTQSDGDKGSVVMYYTDKKGKKHKNCHTSMKKAKGQIAAIEAP